jgi:hypothetical protein
LIGREGGREMGDFSDLVQSNMLLALRKVANTS